MLLKNMNLSNLKKRRIIYFLSCICILFIFFSQQYRPIPFSNQNEYFVHAFAETHPEYLQNDWFVNTQMKHIVFSELIKTFYVLGIVELGTYVSQLILYLLYNLSILIVIYTIIIHFSRMRFDILRHNAEIISLIIVLFIILAQQSRVVNSILILSHIRDWWNLFWNVTGLADQYMLSYFQASGFGILILLSIGLALRSCWYSSVFLLALSVNFHFSYSLHAGVVSVIFTFWLIIQKQYRKACLSTILFTFMVLPVTLYATTFLGNPLSSVANEIWATMAYPRHALPSVFWHNGQLIKLIIIAIGTAVCLYSRLYLLALIQGIGLSYISVGIIFVFTSNNYTLALLFPWRASVYLVPLSTTIIFTIFVVYSYSVATKYIRRFDILNLLLLPILFFPLPILFLEILSFVSWHNEQIITSLPSHDMYQEISELTDVNDIILLPVDPRGDWEDARMWMQRPIYVDLKSVPILGTDVVEWWDRVQFVRLFYQQSLSEQLELCRQAEIDYFISPHITRNRLPVFDLQTGQYELYDC